MIWYQCATCKRINLSDHLCIIIVNLPKPTIALFLTQAWHRSIYSLVSWLAWWLLLQYLYQNEIDRGILDSKWTMSVCLLWQAVISLHQSDPLIPVYLSGLWEWSGSCPAVCGSRQGVGGNRLWWVCLNCKTMSFNTSMQEVLTGKQVTFRYAHVLWWVLWWILLNSFCNIESQMFITAGSDMIPSYQPFSRPSLGQGCDHVWSALCLHTEQDSQGKEYTEQDAQCKKYTKQDT